MKTPEDVLTVASLDNHRSHFESEPDSFREHAWVLLRPDVASLVSEQPDAPRRLSDDQLSLISVGLQDVHLRDALLVAVISGNLKLADQLAVGDKQANVAVALDPLLESSVALRPPPEILTTVLPWLSSQLSRLPAAYRAPLLSIAGLCYWWLDDGQQASTMLKAALEDDQKYRLALLVGAMMAYGMKPGWCVAH